MTAAQILRLNGNMRGCPMMEVVRRFTRLSNSLSLPYCIVGGMAVIRNGYPRATIDVDISHQALMANNLGSLSRDVIDGYRQAARRQCMKIFKEVSRAAKQRPKR